MSSCYSVVGYIWWLSLGECTQGSYYWMGGCEDGCGGCGECMRAVFTAENKRLQRFRRAFLYVKFPVPAVRVSIYVNSKITNKIVFDLPLNPASIIAHRLLHFI